MSWACAMLAAAVLLNVCSSPTEPEPPQAGNPSPATVVIEVSSATLTLNESTSLTVRVTDPQVTQVGLGTNLGHFGLDGSAEPIQSLNVTLANGRAEREFFAGTEAGTATVLANAAGSVGSVQLVIEKPEPLFLERLEPTFGVPAGGTSVKIFGRGLRENPRVTFGGALALLVGGPSTDGDGNVFITVESPQSQADVPVGETLAVSVEVTLPDDGSGVSSKDTLDGAFTYAHGNSPVGPSILSVQPSSGPNRGGVTVTLQGSGFEAGNVTVVFGQGEDPSSFAGVEAVVRSSSAQRISVTLPQASPELLNQAVGVLVRNLSTGLADLAGSAFTYVERDVILDIQPREARYSGGTEVTITAQGIDTQDQFSVEFGGAFQATCPSEVCRFSGESLLLKARPVLVSSCEPPQGSVLLTDTVTGEMSEGPVFTYTAEIPSLQAIAPAGGGEQGGEVLTLRGQFSNVMQETLVLIDNVAVTPTSVGAATIAVTAPPFTGTFEEVSCGSGGSMSVAKAVDVEVLFTETGCSDKQSGAYTYTPDDETCREGPGASFDFVVRGSELLEVRFTDTSSGNPTGWQWSFGDGESSGEQNPSHIYAQGGTFDVSLQVTSTGGTSSTTQSVQVGPAAPQAAFSFSADASNPLRVSFVDLSENDPTEWTWTFGDGATSNEQNPTHTYSTSGSFSVTLTVTNVTASDRITQEVRVGPDPPVASFTFNPDLDDPDRLTVDFLDTSSNDPTSWEWNFGDGSMSREQSPNHPFPAPGTYNVTLRVTNAGGGDSITQMVEVGPGPPVASFTFRPLGALQVRFSDTSAGVVTSRVWDFGDGLPPGIAENLLHTYEAAGIYIVTLQVSNAAGSDQIQQQVVVP